MVVTSTTAGVMKGSKSFTVRPGTWTGLYPAFSYIWRLGTTTVGTNSPTYVEAENSTTLAQPLTVQVSAIVRGSSRVRRT